jgi:2-methylcitrate dehydratase PrpD
VRIAAFLDEVIALRLRQVDTVGEQLLAKAQDAFVDTYACMLAAADHPTVDAVAASALAMDLGGALRCPLRNEQLNALGYALVGGTQAHALDFDDNYIPAVTHASATLVPALSALALVRRASGADVLRAYVFGLEIQGLLGRLINPRHYAIGWHNTATLGTLGVAAACAALMGSGPALTAEALRIATSLCGGAKSQLGSPMKPTHAGLAAMHGLMAARMAEAGMRGSADVFDGPWGFPAMMSHGSAPAPDAVRELHDLIQTAPWLIESDGLAAKRFPCCGSTHRSLDGIEALMREHALAIEDIVSVDLLVPQSNADNLRFERPTTPNEARFSMHYCAAALMVRGRVSLEDFEPAAVADPAVTGMLPLVHMRAHATLPPDGASIWSQPAVTTLGLTDGRTLSVSVDEPIGCR